MSALVTHRLGFICPHMADPLLLRVSEFNKWTCQSTAPQSEPSCAGNSLRALAEIVATVEGPNEGLERAFQYHRERGIW